MRSAIGTESIHSLVRMLVIRKLRVRMRMAVRTVLAGMVVVVLPLAARVSMVMGVHMLVSVRMGVLVLMRVPGPAVLMLVFMGVRVFVLMLVAVLVFALHTVPPPPQYYLRPAQVVLRFGLNRMLM